MDRLKHGPDGLAPCEQVDIEYSILRKAVDKSWDHPTKEDKWRGQDHASISLSSVPACEARPILAVRLTSNQPCDLDSARLRADNMR